VTPVITLAALTELMDEFAEEWEAPVEPVVIDGPAGQVVIGDGPVTLMGCINLSRDSTYRESIAVSADHAVRIGRVQAAQGAGILDLGAESSDYTKTRVTAGDQIGSLVPVVEQLSATAVVSVETYHPEVVGACLEAGAQVLNMTGREHEEEMLRLASEHSAAVLMCYGASANVREHSEAPTGDPVPALLEHFGPRIERARALGVTKIVVDPGIGFNYSNLDTPLDRSRHQLRMLTQAFRLRPLGVPICSVPPHSFDLFGDEFRKGEGFFAVFAALGGAHLLRTHEVPHLSAVLAAMGALDVR
jgi:dihydropteroate synthase